MNFLVEALRLTLLIVLLAQNAVLVVYDIDILQAHPSLSNEYGDTLQHSLKRIKVDNRYTNAFSWQMNVRKEVSCDSQASVEIYAFIHQKFSLFHNGSSSLGDAIYGYPNTTLGQIIRNFQNCSDLVKCPIYPGYYSLDECVLNTNFMDFWVTKTWNSSVQILSQDGNDIAQGWVMFELDDTSINRSKRPSATQKRRRKNWN